METQNKTPRVDRTVKLWTPHNGGEAAFAPLIRGNYRNVGKQILESNQAVPTGDYTASLVDTAYFSPEVANDPEFKAVRDAVKNDWLWVFNVNTWTDKGLYSMKDLEAVGRSDTTSVEQLEAMLKDGKELSWGGIRLSKDGRVGFAPKGSYRLGEHTSDSLAKDGLVVVTYDEKGAEKIGRLSTKFKYNPKTWGIEVGEGKAPEKRVSALGYGFNCGRLNVIGLNFVDYVLGHASGVLNSAEGTAPKK